MKLVFVPLKDVFKECKGKRQFSIKKDAYRRFSSVSNEMQIGIKKIAALYSPRMATTVEADRTCISNIHQGGTPPVEAAAVIVDLAKRMLEQKASGINMTR